MPYPITKQGWHHHIWRMFIVKPVHVVRNHLNGYPARYDDGKAGGVRGSSGQTRKKHERNRGLYGIGRVRPASLA